MLELELNYILDIIDKMKKMSYEEFITAEGGLLPIKLLLAVVEYKERKQFLRECYFRTRDI